MTTYDVQAKVYEPIAAWIHERSRNRLLLRMSLTGYRHTQAGQEDAHVQLISFSQLTNRLLYLVWDYQPDGNMTRDSEQTELEVTIESNPAKFRQLRLRIAERWDRFGAGWSSEQDNCFTYDDEGNRPRSTKTEPFSFVVLQHLARLEGVIQETARKADPRDAEVLYVAIRRLQGVINAGNAHAAKFFQLA